MAVKQLLNDARLASLSVESTWIHQVDSGSILPQVNETKIKMLIYSTSMYHLMITRLLVFVKYINVGFLINQNNLMVIFVFGILY